MPPTPPPTQSALMVCSIANVGLPVLRVSEISTLIGRSTCILLGNFSEENLLILSVFLFHSVLVRNAAALHSGHKLVKSVRG